MLTITELEKQAKATSRLINLRFILITELRDTESSLEAFREVKDLLSPVESQEISSDKSEAEMY